MAKRCSHRWRNGKCTYCGRKQPAKKPRTKTTFEVKSEAMKGNQHATLHGLRASNLPPGCAYLQSQLTAFRRYVRHELVERDGHTTTYQEAVLQSAVRHETRALLSLRWLRKSSDTMSHSERATFLKQVSDATDARDKCLRELGLAAAGHGPGAVDLLFGPNMDDLGDEPADTPPAEAEPAGTQDNGTQGESDVPSDDVWDQPDCDLCEDEGLSGRPCPRCGKME